MATIKTWTYNYNVSPTSSVSVTTQGQSFITQLIAFLVANGWTMTQYTLGTGSVVTGTIVPTLANCITATPGTNHSWFVLASPVGLYPGPANTSLGSQSQAWLLIDMNVGVYYQSQFSFHNSAPTGGTATAGPTSTNQIIWTGAQGAYNSGTVSPLLYFHFLANSQGGFNIFTTISGTGWVVFQMSFMLTVNGPLNVSTGYDYPYKVVASISYYAGTPGVISLNSMFNTSGTINKMWNSDGTAAAVAASVRYDSCPIGNQFPVLGDAWAGQGYGSPIYVSNIVAGKSAFLGFIADIYYCSQGIGVNTGTVAAPTYVQLGYVPATNGGAWFPGNVTLNL